MALNRPSTVPRSRYRTLWIVLAVVVFGIAVAPWLMPLGPMLFRPSDRCHPEGLPTVKVVALSVCVDPGAWSWFMPGQPSKQSYGNGREKIYFDTIGFEQAVPLPEFRAFILKGSEQYGTNKEPITVVSEREVTLGGRVWHALEMASQTSRFVDYYYSAEGFGSVQLFFLSFTENVARRDELAAPILASVTFTK